MAKDWNLGILEGRTGALVHPAIMAFLFGASLYAGYLGYQWRRVRLRQSSRNAVTMLSLTNNMV